LESGVSNCYPGLEYDHRNLDRRFFPGLVFEFVSQEDAANPDATRQGALLRTVDTSDPGLAAPPGFEDVASALVAQLSGDDGTALSSSDVRWFLTAITQTKATIRLQDETGAPFDGLTVWRLVRSLRPGPVTLELGRRDKPGAAPVRLVGWRRRFTDAETG